MSLVHVSFQSEKLGFPSQMYMVVPQKAGVSRAFGTAKVREGNPPVLYLLHGGGDNYTSWQRKTSVERYAEKYGIVVVMPDAPNSFYNNTTYGPDWYDFIVGELPKIVAELTHVSGRREDTYIAGLSMGGYGAMKIGLSNPDKYAAIGCLSAGNIVAADFYNERKFKLRQKTVEHFGVDDIALAKDGPNDLFYLARKLADEGAPAPRIFHACGSEDFGIAHMRQTRDWFESCGAFDYTYCEGPGAHTWEFWDEWIQKFLEWLNP